MLLLACYTSDSKSGSPKEVARELMRCTIGSPNLCQLVGSSWWEGGANGSPKVVARELMRGAERLNSRPRPRQCESVGPRLFLSVLC